MCTLHWLTTSSWYHTAHSTACEEPVMAARCFSSMCGFSAASCACVPEDALTIHVMAAAAATDVLHTAQQLPVFIPAHFLNCCPFVCLLTLLPCLCLSACLRAFMCAGLHACVYVTQLSFSYTCVPWPPPCVASSGSGVLAPVGVLHPTCALHTHQHTSCGRLICCCH